MTKPEIVAFMSQQADISKKAASAVLDSLVMAIHESLKRKGKIKIASLGTFRVLDLDARRGVNPRTGDAMTIPAMRVPRFTPAKALRKAVKEQK